MYDYSVSDREEVVKRSNNEVYRSQPINLGFGYTIYDVLRMILEELGNIENTIKENFSKEKA